MSDNKKPVVTVSQCDSNVFQDDCLKLINEGYVMSSSSCGTIDSAEYDYCETYQAIFILK